MAIRPAIKSRSSQFVKSCYNFVEKIVKGCTHDGIAAGIVFQVVEKVQDNLASVRKICAAGSTDVFDDGGSYIRNKASGKCTKIEQKNLVYTATD